MRGELIDYVMNEYEMNRKDAVQLILNYMECGEASKFYKDNIVLITTRGHIVASKYGQVIDTWDSTKRKVEFIWIVE